MTSAVIIVIIYYQSFVYVVVYVFNCLELFIVGFQFVLVVASYQS